MSHLLWVERYNATLKGGLRKYIDRFKGDWDRAIPFLLFAYREVPCETTGFSPFELMYGKKPRGPMDILREDWVAPTLKGALTNSKPFSYNYT